MTLSPHVDTCTCVCGRGCSPVVPMCVVCVVQRLGHPRAPLFAAAASGRAAAQQPGCGLLLTFFRRPMPPVSPARGLNMRRKSLSGVSMHRVGCVQA